MAKKLAQTLWDIKSQSIWATFYSPFTYAKAYAKPRAFLCVAYAWHRLTLFGLPCRQPEHLGHPFRAQLEMLWRHGQPVARAPPARGPTRSSLPATPRCHCVLSKMAGGLRQCFRAPAHPPCFRVCLNDGAHGTLLIWVTPQDSERSHD